eukprot:15481198-Alexandrium_andersonii.AAC.1
MVTRSQGHMVKRSHCHTATQLLSRTITVAQPHCHTARRVRRTMQTPQNIPLCCAEYRGCDKESHARGIKQHVVGTISRHTVLSELISR